MGTSNQTTGDLRKTVTASGTAEPIAATTLPVAHALITAETDNTGIVVVGGSSVVAAQATRRGVPLNPGDTLVLDDTDLAKVYIDAVVPTDGVTVAYQQ